LIKLGFLVTSWLGMFVDFSLKNRECLNGGALDGAFVGATANAEESVLSPRGSPAVLDDPELLSVLDAVADQQDGVICLLEGVKLAQIARKRRTTSGGIAAPNAAGVVHEGLGDLKCNGERAIANE